MKRFAFLLMILFCFFSINAQEKSSIKKFIKGNIAEKTAAVKEASDSEIDWISDEAIYFCLKNKELLGQDRELDALAVAAILSISNPDKETVSELNELFTLYDKSSNVQIAVLNKAVALKDTISVYEITNTLNNYIKNAVPGSIDSGVFKTILAALCEIGDSDSFTILYKLSNDKQFSSYSTDIENAVVELIPSAMEEVFAMIKGADIKKISSIFALVQKNSKISKKNLCEISEKVLNETILLTENSSGDSAGNIEVQLNALNILDSNKWTRASSLALSYFESSRTLFVKGSMNESQFKTVISSLRNIAPLDAVQPLIAYLEELNGRKEADDSVPAEIALSVINTLGAIGDKAAFDSLLAVTYLDYEESVLTAAREALSGLRWQ